MKRRRLVLVFGAIALVAAVAGGTLLVVRPFAPKATPAAPVIVRWFVGLGSGTQPSQIDDEKAFVEKFNATHKGFQIRFELIPGGGNATDTLKTEIEGENAPDLMGPVGVGGLNGFIGILRDLAPLAAKYRFDLSRFPPDMVADLKQGGDLLSLPYGIYPAFMLYNKDLFAAAGLPDLPKHIGETYMGKTWDWAEVKAIGQRLTLDKAGRHPYDAGFDADHIVQFGLDFQYWDGRRFASAFGQGGAQLVDPAHPTTALIGDNFKAAWRYYYDGMWTSHFIPTGKYRAADLLDDGATFASGKVAMNGSNTWCLGGCYYGDAGKTKMTAVDFAVMPSFNGVTAGPLDVDGFVITKASKHPDEAFQAMLAIMADPRLLADYGSLPAITSQRTAWEDAKTTEARSYFPALQTLSWSAVDEMATHAANPSHESYMSHYSQSVSTYSEAFTRLQNAPGLDMDAELSALQEALQFNFDTGTGSVGLNVDEDNYWVGNGSCTLTDDGGVFAGFGHYLDAGAGPGGAGGTTKDWFRIEIDGKGHIVRADGIAQGTRFSIDPTRAMGGGNKDSGGQISGIDTFSHKSVMLTFTCS